MENLEKYHVADNPIRVDVLGCCVTRDVVLKHLETENGTIVLGENHQCLDEQIPLMVEIKEEYKITNEDLVGRNSGFYRIKQELNATIKNKLMNSKSDWLIMDFHHTGLNIYEVKTDKDTYYFQKDWSRMTPTEIKIAMKKRNENVLSIKLVHYYEMEGLQEKIKQFNAFVTGRYGKKIIVLDLFETHWILEKDGTVHYWRSQTGEERLSSERVFMQRFIEQTGAYYVMCPTNVISDELHRSKSHLHYVHEYYEYAWKCIHNILIGDPDYQQKNNMLFMQATETFDKIRIGDYFSKHNILISIDSQFKSAKNELDVDKVLDYCFKLSDTISDEEFLRDLYTRIGKICRDRNDSKRDLVSASKWFRKAISVGCQQSKIELFETLWEENNPESLLEMVSFSFIYSNQGDYEFTGRIGLMYKEGRGVPKNLDEAVKWLRIAADHNVDWAKWEYFNTLWNIDSEQSLKAMIKYARQESKNGNLKLKAGLARAYRDGKGVTKDLTVAAKLMKDASKGKLDWAKKEYFDILWEINTPETDATMIKFAIPIAESGNKHMAVRMGNAYRYGRGVAVDYNESKKWYEIAISKNLEWAKNNLFDLLWEMKTDDNAMYLLASNYAKKGNGPAIARLGKCYHFGRGVDADLKRAKQLYESAIKKKVKWVQKYLEML